jgi:hypothetical protein
VIGTLAVAALRTRPGADRKVRKCDCAPTLGGVTENLCVNDDEIAP